MGEIAGIAEFVPTSSFHPPDADQMMALLERAEMPQKSSWSWTCFAIDARHGLVLLDCFPMLPAEEEFLLVWDPRTHEWWEIFPIPDFCDDHNDCHAAVLCAPAASGHLHCHGTPFLVVRVVTQSESQRWCLRVYSSEDASWSGQTLLPECTVDKTPAALVWNTLYFMTDAGTRALGFDLATQEVSVIFLPPKVSDSAAVLMEKDGGLGFATVDMTARLSLWSMEVNPNGHMEWTKTRVIELEKVLRVNAESISYRILAHAVGIFFLGAHNGLFSFDLKSGRVRKVFEEYEDGNILDYKVGDALGLGVPYTGFCTPGHKRKSLSDLLREHNLPPGLFPRNIICYMYDKWTSKLVVHLSEPCEVSFKDSSTIRYAPRVKATLSRGKLSGIEGMKIKVVVWVKVVSVSIESNESDKICFIAEMRQKDAYEVPREAISAEEF